MDQDLKGTRRKIVLKRKDLDEKTHFARITIDASMTRQSSVSELKPARLSSKSLKAKCFLVEQDSPDQSVASTLRIRHSLARHIPKRDQLTAFDTNQPAICRIINPTSRKILVGLPYVNLSLLEPHWWTKYQGQCVQNMRHGYGKLYLSNGEQFQGTFFENQASGHGIYFRSGNNPPVEGIWEQNRLTRLL